MNKKGFTLVELLAVIVVLGIVATIGVASVNGISNAIKKDLLNKKYESIEEAAILYGEDMREAVKSGSEVEIAGKTYHAEIVKIADLVPKYLAPDTECKSGNECVLDPSDKNNELQDKCVIIYYKNKRIHAKVDADNTYTC